MQYSEILKIKETHKARLLACRGVVGVGIGYKRVNGEETEHLSIIVGVERKIPLNELEEDEIYQFRVESRDIHNHSTVSSLHSLKVSEIAATVEKNMETIPSSPAIVGEFEILRTGPSRVAIYWQTNIPTSFCFEWQEMKKKLQANQKKVLKEEKIHGLGLRDNEALGINSCYGCHPPNILGLSHPVGVYPKGDIEIPDDLPTAEGGMLTCITCHYPHGSNQKFLARKKIAKELCQSCHGEDY